uniref:primosomal protein N' n=1 Tax=Virgisporangium aliadipatigenens TaxID=741659 RepID=UPI0035709771
MARVCVDVPLAHLDRPFDYLVPAEADDAARPGVRVRVRFAGQLVSGFLLERVAESEHEGRLTFLDRVVSPEVVLTAGVAEVARAVADRYAGTLADVLRLAVPPRHAKVEAAAPEVPSAAREVPAGASGALVEKAAGTGLTAGPDSAPGGKPARVGPPAGPDGASGVPGEKPAGTELPAGPDGAPGVTEEKAAGTELPVGSGDDVAKVPSGSGGAGSAGDGSAGAAGDVVAGPEPQEEIAGDSGWDAYTAGRAFLRAIAAGKAPRAVWNALPGEDWPARIAGAVAAAFGAGRGALVVVADQRDLDRVDAALTAMLGAGRHVALSAAVGPAERYRRFLAASRGRVRVVAGTRAAALAPVEDLGLVAIWDDGDDLHAEPRAPYPHARQVLLTRAELTGCAVLVGGFARTAEAQQLVETGWARQVLAERSTVRERAPAVTPTGDDFQRARDPAAAAARLPSVAWRAARDALAAGTPVLVQVPRRGYLPAVACDRCGTPARCEHCSGPLALPSATGTAFCRWCGRSAADHRCGYCGDRRMRASVVGARRTAEELGRAFPGAPVRTSGREGVLASVPGQPAVVVSTPGAEPVAEGGYGAVLLLDTWALLTRADLRAGEETVRRWFAAAALARPAAAGGQVVVVAEAGLAAVQALVRWDAAWLAARELAERRELGFPPAARMVSLTGVPEAVAELLEHVDQTDVALLGPVEAEEEGQERVLLRTSRAGGPALSATLRTAAGIRSARKAPHPVRIQVDPLELL